MIDGDVTFEYFYPHINLVGHTFSCEALTLSAPKGSYASMCMSNGVVKIGDKQYTENETITSVGEGNVILDLCDLK